MYAAGDPRAALAAPSERKVSAPTQFSGAEYAKFYETSARDDDSNGRSWYVRGQNFILAYSETKPGAILARSKQPDEYAIMIPDKDVSIEITVAGEAVKVPGYSIAFVPPGDSRISVPSGGRVVRLFSYKCEDMAAKCSNAQSYAKPHPNIPPFEPWPEPKGGFRIRHYSLDVKGEQGRFGRIFRCTNFMINYLEPKDGPRDTSKLSPHFHDDFEQCSLALDGDFIHDIRWPWIPDMAAWRDDDHERCAAPSAAVIPPPAIHTTRAIGPKLNQLVDIFSPPRVDFSMKEGWVLNADDYPMPASLRKG
jgi:ribosomal protein L24E